jgi:hypothetical protein
MEPRSGCAFNAAVEALGDHGSFVVLPGCDLRRPPVPTMKNRLFHCSGVEIGIEIFFLSSRSRLS